MPWIRRQFIFCKFEKRVGFRQVAGKVRNVDTAAMGESEF